MGTWVHFEKRALSFTSEGALLLEVGKSVYRGFACLPSQRPLLLFDRACTIRVSLCNKRAALQDGRRVKPLLD